MKIIIIFLILFFIQLQANEIFTFDEFKKKYKKQYKSEQEEIKRKEIYDQNLKKIQQHNTQHTTYLQGINIYSDYTDEELLLLTKKTKQQRLFHWKTVHQRRQFHLQNEPKMKRKQFKSLPTNYSLCGSEAEIDHCGSINIDQGNCGCCYAAGTAHHLSSLYSYLLHQQKINKTDHQKLFSVQQLIDCSSLWGGCGGGFAEFCLESNDYFVLNKDYPFIDFSTSCESPEECKKYRHQCKLPNKTMKSPLQLRNLQKRYTYFSRLSWEDIKDIIYRYHGFITAMKVSPSLYRYTGGIYKDESCENQLTDHVVVVDGYGEEGKRKYLWVRNSWGKNWGIENGHFKIDFETTCGINNRDQYEYQNGETVYLDNNMFIEVELTNENERNYQNEHFSSTSSSSLSFLSSFLFILSILFFFLF